MAKKGKENAQNPAADQPQTGSQAAQVDTGAVALRPLGDAEPQIDDQAGPRGEGVPADSEGRPASELLDDEGGTVDGGLLDGEGVEGGLAAGKASDAGAEEQGAGAADTGTEAEKGSGGASPGAGISVGDLEGALSSGGTDGVAHVNDAAERSDELQTYGSGSGSSGHESDVDGGDDRRTGNDGGGDRADGSTADGNAGADPGADRGDRSAVSGADGAADSGDAAGAGGAGLHLRDGGDGGETGTGALGGGDPAAGGENGDGLQPHDGRRGGRDGLHDEGAAEASQDRGGDDDDGDLGRETHLEDPSLSPIDGIVQAAEEACFAVGDHLVEFWEFDQAQQQRLALLAGWKNSRATNAIASLVREIGRDRATPAVCGQQLKILKLIDTPELSDVETLIVQTFVNVLAGIDAFEKAEVARLEAAAAKPQVRKPIPIEDTTMELVDDTLGTFGGRS